MLKTMTEVPEQEEMAEEIESATSYKYKMRFCGGCGKPVFAYRHASKEKNSCTILFIDLKCSRTYCKFLNKIEL